MVDRYSAYKAMQQVKEGQLRLAFCWAHVRRDFVRVGKANPELKAWALDWLRLIRELYRLQHARRDSPPLSDEYRAADAALRQHLDVMEQQRDSQRAAANLREPCRKALTSLAERLMRNPALGRKNYYGSGADWAGRLAMMMFSIWATLKLWNINPRQWLNAYLQACAETSGQPPPDIEPFLPWNLSDDQRAAWAHPRGRLSTTPPEAQSLAATPNL
jgi:transposase